MKLLIGAAHKRLEGLWACISHGRVQALIHSNSFSPIHSWVCLGVNSLQPNSVATVIPFKAPHMERRVVCLSVISGNACCVHMKHVDRTAIL